MSYITFMDTRGVTIHLAREMRQNIDTKFTRTRQYFNTIFKKFSMTKYLSFNHKYQDAELRKTM